MSLIRVGISSCLLGEPVRYDGRHKHDPFIITELGHFFELVGVCPEYESGMPVPRDPMQLVPSGNTPRLVVIRSGQDMTGQMHAFCKCRLAALAAENLCGFVLKSNSPSCGLSVGVYPGTGGTPASEGRGLFAAALAARFPEMPVVEERWLHEPAQCSLFIERVFRYCRHMQ